MTNTQLRSTLLLFLAALALIAGMGYFYTKEAKRKPAKLLDTFGRVEEDSIGAGGERFTISRPKKVGPFSFIDQTGATITQADFAGKIYVTDFFFTTCQSICIPMGKNMSALAKDLKAKPDLLFLSHTVHPENDSVPVLLEYARLHQADPKQWHLVTGSKKALYDMARFQYFIDATVGNGGPEDFLHSDKFTLVDKQSYIRGYYDGTLPSEMERLKKDIALLEQEERLARE